MIDLIVSSPPYADSVNAQRSGIDWEKAQRASPGQKRGAGCKHFETFNAQLSYGSATGQLGAMKEGPMPADLIVSSPPYAESFGTLAGGGNMTRDEQYSHGRRGGALYPRGYSADGRNLGNIPEGPMPTPTPTAITPDLWQRCYNDGWQGLIAPAAFQHPAKVARGLARRIYDHAREQGWLTPGCVVADPFGGIGGCAYYAAHRGVRYVGVELEPRFHALALENFALWAHLSRCDPDYVAPQMLSGDSRRLCELVSEAGLICSSPPYAESVGSPSLGSVNKDDWGKDGRCIAARRGLSADYGQTPGQLGNLPAGDAAAVISSPPYEETFGARSGPSGLKGVDGTGLRSNGMPLGLSKADIAVNAEGYGTTEGNIGNAAGDTFWSAARIIVEQCHRILRPGGHSIWVVKNYVKDRQIVDFEGNWQRLCEQVGFRTVCLHRAMLTREWQENNLFAGPQKRQRKKCSFFRRLAEKKGAPEINWESVLCMERPT